MLDSSHGGRDGFFKQEWHIFNGTFKRQKATQKQVGIQVNHILKHKARVVKVCTQKKGVDLVKYSFL